MEYVGFFPIDVQGQWPHVSELLLKRSALDVLKPVLLAICIGLYQSHVYREGVPERIAFASNFCCSIK